MLDHDQASVYDAEEKVKPYILTVSPCNPRSVITLIKHTPLGDLI